MSPVAVEASVPVAGVPPPPNRTRLLLMVVVAVVIVAGGGVGAWLMFFRPHAAAQAAAPAESEVHATFPLGAVVVNVNGEARRYLRASVSVGIADVKALKEVEEAKPQMLDLCITVLSQASGESLLTAAGREAVKEALVARMRKDLSLPAVAKVYFTEFVVQ